jgi:hypothetical protein
VSDWIISIEGTEAGARLALVLALLAAVLHAIFGALQKGRHDPLLARGAIDASYGLMAAPFALFVVPWPEPHMWPIFAGVFVIHAALQMGHARRLSAGRLHRGLPGDAGHRAAFRRDRRVASVRRDLHGRPVAGGRRAAGGALGSRSTTWRA